MSLRARSFTGGKDTSRNNVALNLGKPNVDLIELAGIGRGVMNPNGRVSLKKFKNFLGFVCTQVIGDHGGTVTCWLTSHDLRKEVDELGILVWRALVLASTSPV